MSFVEKPLNAGDCLNITPPYLCMYCDTHRPAGCNFSYNSRYIYQLYNRRAKIRATWLKYKDTMAKNDYVIEAKNLTKSYGANHVLKGINLKVERGTMLALLGPNGAGKTTTVRILSTLLKHDGGTVSVEGHDVDLEADKSWRGMAG